MNIDINKKAVKIINSFNGTERAVYEYIIELMKQDAQNFKEIEIARRAGDNPAKVKEGYKLVYRMNERAAYIMQCLGIHIKLNETNDTLIITI